MKIRTIIPLVIMFFLIGAMKAQKNGKLIEITNKCTKLKLGSLADALAADDIRLTIEKTGFDNEGHLTSVSGKIYFSKKNNGSFACDKLGIVIIRNSKREFSISAREEIK